MVWVAGAPLTAAELNEYAPQEWTDYTPTWVNTTLGNGTRSGRYIRFGNTVRFWAYFSLGSTSAMGGNPTVLLPFTASSNNRSVVQVFMQDAGSNFHLGWGITGGSSTHAQLFGLGGPGGTGGANPISATSPFTWATTDDIYVCGEYEAA